MNIKKKECIYASNSQPVAHLIKHISSIATQERYNTPYFADCKYKLGFVKCLAAHKT